jgi:hypothetical protein
LHAYDVQAGYPDSYFAFFAQPGQTMRTEIVVAGKTMEDLVFQLPPQGTGVSKSQSQILPAT